MRTRTPPQLAEVPTPTVPKTIADAVAHMHRHTENMAAILDRLDRMFAQWTGPACPPELRTVVINPTKSAAGPFVAIDRVRQESQSVGVLNPGPQPVSIGIGGVSAAAGALAPQVPANAALVLPVRAGDLELGTPSALGAASQVIYVFRYSDVQPLFVAAT